MSALWSSNAFYFSSVQRKELDFLNKLYKGSLHSPNRDTKQLRAMRHPMSCWTSLTFLTWPISAMAEILSGFASMPRLVMI
jgi:hypothetical protein